MREDFRDDIGAPGIDGEQRGVVMSLQLRPFGEEGLQAVDLFIDADGLAVRAGAFRADVDDVRAIAELLDAARRSERPSVPFAARPA